MIRSQALFRTATALTLLAVLAVSGCGGKKRPPAVLTDPSRTTAPPASPTPWPSPADAPPDAGPDVLPMGEEGTRAVDYSADTETASGALTDILFPYNEAALTDEARATLEKHALWLQNHREAKITIEGHCDERGTVDYNLALGDQRARAARDYLLNLGVAAERMNAISLGKERPIDPASNEQAWAKNRRAHFVLVR
jgi:peptidoglycan-associated lipoprotein